MITIAPAPALPVVLPDSAAPGPFGADEAEGPAFAAELALAMAGGEPAKLPPAPTTRAVPADGIRMTIAFPAPDTGAAPFEPTTSGLDAAAPLGTPAEAVTAATERIGAPPAEPMPDAQATAPSPATPPPVPSAAPEPAPTATLRSAPDAAAPEADALPEAQPVSSIRVRGSARAEGHGADAEAMTDPGSRSPAAPAADRVVPPVEARPVEARPTLASEPHALGDAAAADGVAPSGVEAKAEARRPSRTRLADEPSPRVTDQTVVADTDPLPPAAGDLAEAAPDAPPPDARDGVSADRPPPQAPAGQPTPEMMGLAAAAIPAPRPAGDVPRPRGGVGTAAATAGAEVPTPPGDAAEPAPRPAPAETARRAAAEARPDPAEPAPATDGPRPAAAQAAEPATEPRDPTGNPADRTEQPPPRTEAAPRALAPPGAAEALPQLQPVERAAPVAAAPPVPRAAPTPPAQQIAPVLITLAAGAAGMPDRLTLTLDPQELGRIEVEVSREGERRVAIAVLAERPETLHLLMRDAAILDRALAQAGVGAEGRSLAFDLGGGSDGRQQRGNGAATPGSSTTPQPEPARPRDPLSLLDIAI